VRWSKKNPVQESFAALIGGTFDVEVAVKNTGSKAAPIGTIKVRGLRKRTRGAAVVVLIYDDDEIACPAKA
jgi:hypothetical protein